TRGRQRRLPPIPPARSVPRMSKEAIMTPETRVRRLPAVSLPSFVAHLASRVRQAVGSPAPALFYRASSRPGRAFAASVPSVRSGAPARRKCSGGSSQDHGARDPRRLDRAAADFLPPGDVGAPERMRPEAGEVAALGLGGLVQGFRTV